MMALLTLGSAGAEVKQLQEFLNRLPTALPRLEPDGQFGSRTQARVREFQGDNGLSPDGVIGPFTLAAIEEAVRLLGRLMPLPKPPPAVRLITEEVLGPFPARDNLIQQILPVFSVIDETRFVPNRSNVPFQFRVTAPIVGRLAIFAAQKGNDERAVILFLPQSRPDRILIHISQGFGQAIETVGPLGFKNAISPPLIQFCLLKHIINRYGPQTLAARKNMGLMYIVRAAGKSELGPFAKDGPFTMQVLREMAALTNDGFATDVVEAFTFSSGIVDFNPFINALQSQVKIAAVYNIDPSHALAAAAPAGATRKQYLSGQTGGPLPGFEFAPRPRWVNEDEFVARKKDSDFQYLHNFALPRYVLYLGIQTS
jgi:peptidoglycan hydrolase-like protein with peptidoglycan-binding domain